MPTWQADILGDVYEIDASDEGQAATQALKMRQQAAQADPKKAAAYAAALPADQREQPSPMAAQSPIYQAVGNSTLGDLAGSIATGTRNIAEGAVGQFGDVMDLGTRAGNWLTGASPERAAELEAVRQKSLQGYVPTTQDVHDYTSQVVGPSYQPQSTAGEVLKTGTELAPAVLAPGSVMRKVATWAGATIGNEGGGRIARAINPAYEPYGRAAGTILGGGVASVASAPKSAVKTAASDLGVKGKDLTRVIKRMQADGMSPQDINAELQRLGSDATLMDVGPNLRQEGQRIVAKGGEGRAMITDALTARDAGANQRIRSEIDANLGPAPVPSEVKAGIRGNQKALSPAYKSVFANAKAVDTQNIANNLDSMIVTERGAAQSKLRDVRKMLDVTGTDQLDPNPQTLHATREAIDGMLTGETDGNVKRVLTLARNKIDEELAAKVPGIKEVDAQYAELARQKTAVDEGQTVFDTGRTALRPSELTDKMAKGAEPQGLQLGPSAAPVRFRQGARADIERIIGTNANDRVALQRIIKGEGDWNPQKLATLFGQDKADRILAVLDREKTFDLTSNRVIKNSATAERLPEENGPSFGVREAFMAGGPKATLYAGAIRGVEGLLDKVRSRAAMARDANVATLLTQTDRNKLVTAMMKANGGKAVGPNEIDGAVRMMLLLSGSTQPLRQINQ